MWNDSETALVHDFDNGKWEVWIDGTIASMQDTQASALRWYEEELKLRTDRDRLRR
jgi:hypothetical protein